MKTINLIGAAAIAVFTMSAGAFAVNYPMVGGAAMYPSRNIIENAMNSKDHTTLVAAVKAGGLVETLEGAGPFTVFAPTNEAFAALPAGTVDSLLKPENKAQLDKVLTYHVVAGKYMSADVKSKTALKTLEGHSVTLDPSNGMKVDEAMVIAPDVLCTNGVIHVIDAVLLPA